MEEPKAKNDQESESDVSRIKRRRGTSGVNTDCCRTCRARKVRCTGNNGGLPCGNCARLDLECSFTTPGGDEVEIKRKAPSKSHTEAGTLRKRAQRACRQCHDHKTKCSGDLPRCKRCEANNLQCEYTPPKRRFASGPFQPSSPESRESSQVEDDGPSGSQNPKTLLDYGASLQTENLVIPKDLLLAHVDAYLEHLYPLTSLGFLHPSITHEAASNGTLDPAVATSICSVSAWLLAPGSEDARDFAQRCHSQVEVYLHANRGVLTQGHLLLHNLDAFYCLMTAQYGKVWMNLSNAARLVFALQLNWDPAMNAAYGEFYQQEIARRLVWQVYNLDRLLAGGYDEHLLTPDKAISVRLPCDERPFRENKAVVMETLEGPASPAGPRREGFSLQGCLIRLVSMRHQIINTTRKFRIPPTQLVRLEPSKIMEDVARLHTELARFRETLPDAARLTDRNVRQYWESPERSSFVMLHTYVSQLHVDLYSFSVPGMKEEAHPELLRTLPRDFLQKCQKQAVAHAISLARFWEDLASIMRETPAELRQPFLTADFILVVCAVQVVRVLLSATLYRLYFDLNQHSTAPLLGRNEEMSEEVINLLINSVLGIVRPISQLFPITKSLYDGMVEIVEQSDNNPFGDRPGGQGKGSESATTSPSSSRGNLILPSPLNTSGGYLPGMMGPANPAGPPLPDLPELLAKARGLDVTRTAASSPLAPADHLHQLPQPPPPPQGIMAIDSLRVSPPGTGKLAVRGPPPMRSAAAPPPPPPPMHMLPSGDPALAMPRTDPFAPPPRVPGAGGASGAASGAGGGGGGATSHTSPPAKHAAGKGGKGRG